MDGEGVEGVAENWEVGGTEILHWTGMVDTFCSVLKLVAEEATFQNVGSFWAMYTMKSDRDDDL